MAYEKKSFLAGIAVGRQLKGWSTSKNRGGDEERDVASVSTFSVRAMHKKTIGPYTVSLIGQMNGVAQISDVGLNALARKPLSGGIVTLQNEGMQAVESSQITSTVHSVDRISDGAGLTEATNTESIGVTASLIKEV